ncbi:MFS transporter [Novosphingobium endophyticum]|uniref:MFS transporter n=1 Tax=Novosphingobium endophyticum TaxID=1955250 RepID=A0A916X4N2_9SPHN|nr:MFS transporter [Novosphingobium endophyticum]GGB90287.1 MFS transporter [Novosphingobium endophyticum]
MGGLISQQPAAAAEWRSHWPLVLAAAIGFSFHSVVSNAIGLFIEPLNAEFGWSRAEITAGLSLTAFMTVPLAPVVGAAIDRWGARRLALPGLVLTAGAVASFGLASGSVTQWLALWVMYAFISLSVKSTVWTAAVSGTFDAGRSLALGLTLAGTAVAQTIVPPLAQWLIADFGWRQAWYILGFGWGALAFITSVFFLYGAHERTRERAKDPRAKAPPVLYGLDLKEALRDPALLRIALATLITMFLGIAVIVHQVPILTDAGVSRESAALLASLAGIAGIVGKITTGWLMDRFTSGWIGGFTLSAAAIGFLLLLEPFRTTALIVVAMIIIGYSTGANFQITTYLTSRYGGMKSFGKIFGTMSILVTVGAGLGPVVAGAIYDMAGSYTPLLIAGIPGAIISGLLIVGLGPYPEWNEGRVQAEA